MNIISNYLYAQNDHYIVITMMNKWMKRCFNGSKKPDKTMLFFNFNSVYYIMSQHCTLINSRDTLTSLNGYL